MKVLGKDEDGAAFDLAPARYDGVTQVFLLIQAELRGPVGDEGVELYKGFWIQEQRDALASGLLTLGVLGGNTRVAASGQTLAPHSLELAALVFELFLDGHGSTEHPGWEGEEGERIQATYYQKARAATTSGGSPAG